jgi:ribosomal protein S27AE
VKHRRCPHCGKFAWMVIQRWSRPRWPCARCGALLQANPLRMKASFWIVLVALFIIAVWPIGHGKAEWTDYVMFFVAAMIVTNLVEFVVGGVRRAEDTRDHVDHALVSLADTRHGKSPTRSGRMQHRRCPNCGVFVWRLSSWSQGWSRAIWDRRNCPQCGVRLQSDPLREEICARVHMAVLVLGFLISLTFDSSFWYTPSFWCAVGAFVIVLVLLGYAISGVQLAQEGEERVAYAPGDPIDDIPRRCPACGTLAQSRWRWSWERGIWTRWTCRCCGIVVQSVSAIRPGA